MAKKKASKSKKAAGKKKTKSVRTVKKASKKSAKKALKKPAKKSLSKKKTEKVGSPLKVGQTAPEFALVSDRGEIISLEGLKGQWVVLYFYPKDMTPGCTTQACDFQGSLSQLKGMGVVVLGVSRDDLESHKKFREKHGLEFDLLSDLEGRLCEAYGVWKEKSMYGKKYMGIERTTFIINPEGAIAKIYPKVKVTGHHQDVIDSIASLKNP